MTRPTAARLPITSASDLDAATIVRVARSGAQPDIAADLSNELDAVNRRMLDALAEGASVYGVNTGMGAMSGRTLDAQEQARQQEHLMVARAVGTAPWLDADEARAVLAVRLRTFLNGDAGVRPRLCGQIALFLEHDLLPAIPREAMGAAGEILALAHLGATVSGNGYLLDGAGSAVEAGSQLGLAGVRPLPLAAKEGVALIEGVPVTTALAILRVADARRALDHALTVTAAEFALTAASTDCLDPALARGDDTLATTTARLRALIGSSAAPRALQPPVSFRVTAGVLAHLERSLSALDAAIIRALDGVTDSPAFLLDDDDDRFVGTAGFSGFDLAAHLQQVTAALVAAAEVGAARLHRLMDSNVSGRDPQLAADPGPQAGLSPVHKRAVGIVHELRRTAAPNTLGTIETSLGQEDVQSFSIEAAESMRRAVAGFTDVLACELLACHQLRCLGATLPTGSQLEPLLATVAELLPGTTNDRPWGLDLVELRAALGRGALGDLS